MDSSNNKTSNLLLTKMQKFCAYQERSEFEVKEKLKRLGCGEAGIKKIVQQLSEADFLNDERFANTFSRGKFRLKKWGKRKIEFELQTKNISHQIIKNALENIEQSEYENTLEILIKKKWPEIKGKDITEKKARLARHLITKGYESNLVWDKIMKLKKLSDNHL